MRILGIETSCDETALSIVECSGDLEHPQFEVIDSVLDSQVAIHAEFGGVHPTLAKREHQKNLPLLLAQLMEGKNKDEIDAIAVTHGPGLEPALWTGIVFAKELGEKWRIPVIPTNHMEGHIVSVLLPALDKEGTTRSARGVMTFPAIALLISGGHTELIEVEAWGKYKMLGATVDDAVGEAFDKVARLLGLPYPGGPEISRLAEQARSCELEAASFKLPRPMIHSKDFNFSFSGLKTSVLYLVQKLTAQNLQLTATEQMQIAREFEDAVTEVLLKKTFKAIEETGAETLIIGGGVIANTHIRQTFERECAERNITLLLSSKETATDNAQMIAAAGYFSILQNTSIEKDFKAEGNLRLGDLPRGEALRG